jgi:hypothetical protein
VRWFRGRTIHLLAVRLSLPLVGSKDPDMVKQPSGTPGFSGTPWPPLIVLVAFGWQLNTSHASSHGPIAFALLIVASIWLWWSERKAAGRKFATEDLREFR